MQRYKIVQKIARYPWRVVGNYDCGLCGRMFIVSGFGHSICGKQKPITYVLVIAGSFLSFLWHIFTPLLAISSVGVKLRKLSQIISVQSSRIERLKSRQEHSTFNRSFNVSLISRPSSSGGPFQYVRSPLARQSIILRMQI